MENIFVFLVLKALNMFSCTRNVQIIAQKSLIKIFFKALLLISDLNVANLSICKKFFFVHLKVLKNNEYFRGFLYFYYGGYWIFKYLRKYFCLKLGFLNLYSFAFCNQMS